MDEKKRKGPTKAPKAAKRAAKPAKPRLLSGGNPQVAKADGEVPVRVYIDALPGWKRSVGKRLDELIVATVPGIGKAVRWNTPLYGIRGKGFMIGFHAFAKCVKVTFFRGSSLKPPVAGGSGAEARWIDIHEDDFDENQLRDWVAQAATLPGWSKW
jgi:hypothetical protein